MKQPESALQTHTQPQYSIYVYYYPQDMKDRCTDWERVDVTGCLKKASDEADRLFQSGEYRKVEIKKRSFHLRYQCTTDEVCKAFYSKKRLSHRSKIMALFGFSCFVGIGVVSLPFLSGF